MAARNIAREVLWPTDTTILVRVAFLHVGQGASAVVFVKDGGSYRVLLVDINLDRRASGIDVPRMMKDLLDGKPLDAFVNTHPHDDHLCGTKELSELVDIMAVWHSNHMPSRKYGSKHSELTSLIAKVKKSYGQNAEIIIEGSRTPCIFAEAAYHFLAPAEHVTDDVNEEDADERRARIHEQCGVIKFGKDQRWVIIVGDADRLAFEKHINEYHKDRLPSSVLCASHHGSRTFFVENEGDDPYTAGLESISPDYIIISAPRQNESRHEHPHDDAVDLYKEHVGPDNVLHTGEKRYSFITDIYSDGSYSGVQDDQGELSRAYSLASDDADPSAPRATVPATPVDPVRHTRVDNRPMGNH